MPARQIPREKGLLAKKIADTEGGLFFAFSKLARGHGEIKMSALPPKADIHRSDWNVCFVPKADILHCSDYSHLLWNALLNFRP